ncbi:hypothetical protein [Micromonospora tulbaghiae]|uniref:hypothetical protein n=1 Tax=Micromonospora tulbaghiae TaxID=479978 RepID=UPI0034114622
MPRTIATWLPKDCREQPVQLVVEHVEQRAPLLLRQDGRVGGVGERQHLGGDRQREHHTAEAGQEGPHQVQHARAAPGETDDEHRRGDP